MVALPYHTAVLTVGVPYLGTVRLTAITAKDPTGERTLREVSVCGFLPSAQLPLNHIPSSCVYNGRMAVLYVVLRKGIPAAMFMMQSKTIIKSCAESGMSVEQVFTVANEKLCEGNDAGMFVTAWMGILNVKTGKVLFANAGHNPPLVKHADGTYEYLKTRAGFVLAGMEGVRYRGNELELAPGDAIYLYTDGVTEATDLNTELYGEDRLHTVLEKYKDAAPHVICDEVKRDVDAFVGEAPQFDDITMLALKYNGQEDAQ